jgi:hypothetical protein
MIHSDVALDLAGGSITGAGVIQAEGAINVDGISMADPPTLGARLGVGDGSAVSTMTFSQDAVPLVVVGDADIVMNPNATVTFDTLPQGGPAAVAVVAGDQAPHAMTLDGGLVQQGDSSQLLVGLGGWSTPGRWRRARRRRAARPRGRCTSPGRAPRGPGSPSTAARSSPTAGCPSTAA